ncbi:MAG: thermonuclease family protein [Armatimonadota bacterium]
MLRRTAFFTLTCLLAGATFVLLVGLQAVPALAVQPGTLQGTVVSVVDGDTTYVRVNGRTERVRFIGVNCPELSHPSLGIREEPYGRKAATYTTRKLRGKKVWLELDVEQQDKYGRLLAYVWLARPSSSAENEVRAKMLNAHLLLDGYAQVMTIPPNVKYADLFVKLQREAIQKGRGLWSTVESPPARSVGLQTYIGNRRSGVFHYPTCIWAR